MTIQWVVNVLSGKPWKGDRGQRGCSDGEDGHIVYCYSYMGSTMRREHVVIQNVRHLQHVIRKPDVGKSCQGRAIKVNARESYDSPCSRSFVGDGRRVPKHRHPSPHAYQYCC